MLPFAASTPASRRVRAFGLKKTAWIAFFVLGLCFWIPAILRAKLGASAVPGESAVGAPAPSGTVLAGAGASSGTVSLGAGASSGAASPSAMPETPGAIASTAAPALLSAPAAPASRLLVTTTILGRARRAAIVNGRLYREGDKIGAGSELYRLAKVAEDRIEVVALRLSPGVERSVMLLPTSDPDRDRSLPH